LIRDKNVLEIGAAAGVPSIVSAIQGARTVVMTDYHDPDLVSNMQYNADLSAHLIPEAPESRKRLYVDGYKWGNPVEPLLAYLPLTTDGTQAKFDVLIMADVIYAHREHGNLVKIMQQTLKKESTSVALVIFTAYQPWLLPQTERFFPLAEAGGFTVTKIFEKLMGKVLFEDDPGVGLSDSDANETILTCYRTRKFGALYLGTSFDGHRISWTPLLPRPLKIDMIPLHLQTVV
jgi:nicotinamide N-methyltransferase